MVCHGVSWPICRAGAKRWPPAAAGDTADRVRRHVHSTTPYRTAVNLLRFASEQKNRSVPCFGTQALTSQRTDELFVNVKVILVCHLRNTS